MYGVVIHGETFDRWRAPQPAHPMRSFAGIECHSRHSLFGPLTHPWRNDWNIDASPVVPELPQRGIITALATIEYSNASRSTSLPSAPRSWAKCAALSSLNGALLKVPTRVTSLPEASVGMKKL